MQVKLAGNRRRASLFALGAAALVVGTANADLGDQLAKLLPNDAEAFDTFGTSAAISGTTVIIGATGDSENGLTSGSAYLFDTLTGLQTGKLLAADGEANDHFGISVGISETTAIVGAHLHDDIGSAYLFDTATGQQVAQLLPSDAAIGDYFGNAVAISGTIAIVGAYLDDDNGPSSGSAYLFDTVTGQQLAKLLPNDGADMDFFGISVAISGEIAIVGAFHADDNGSNSGSAYLFDTSTGQQIAKLLPADGGENQLFGWSVGIDGRTAIVGTPWAIATGKNSGSAYLFDTVSGQQITQLAPRQGSSNAGFGYAVAISGSTAIVTALGDDANGMLSGGAYLFETLTGRQIAKILPTDGEPEEYFGTSAAISDSTAIVGAIHDKDNGFQSGSAYLFDAEHGVIGTNYCGPANLNSTGMSAVIGAVGNDNAALNLLILKAYQLPPGRLGLFLNSDVQAFKPFPPGAQGNLCLGGVIGRHLKQIGNTGSSGRLVAQVDLTALPGPNGTHSVVAGETWNFQCWFRDQNPGPTSNFTDAISITFE